MDYTCKTCYKSFNTKQQLQRHEQKRFKCEPINETKEEVFKCSCGKEYKYASGLCRHRAVCVNLLKPATVKALQQNINSINTIDALDIGKINWNALERTCIECHTESDIFKVHHHGITRRWGKFRSICEHIIKQVLFSTPENMVFYIPNLSIETALMYDGETVNEITVKDLVEHIHDVIDTVIDDMIERFKLVEEHPFVFIHNYSNNSRPREVSTEAYKFLQENNEKYILTQYKENKDDIRAVWRKAGIL